ncbi:sigma 54-interacting transcriptional regulator [Pectobacterium carotovorum]|uniref:sigma 54-interacting transcriptional regulator n=1 Tax=Pectobacterium carotovorum TaxID=554 RepID=UPI001CF4A059|nr:sigma 54-interacting transcriptional regulator [Pectobacterium carotovorum]MCA6974210.1 sigma 54-interacting transcriptional regulator [Pectobacterium carotovorum]
MDIRILNFSDEKCSAGWAPYWHQVSQTPTRQQTVLFNRDINSMISQAMMNEWKQALIFLMEQENIKELVKKYPRFRREIDLIADNGPSVVLQKERDLFSGVVTDPYDQANDHLFVSQARTIVTRKTVFLLPDGSPSGSVLYQMDNRNEFIRSLSTFLCVDNASIALAKSRHKASAGDSIFDTVMALLSARNSQLRMDEDTGIHEKDGPLLIEGDTGTGKSAAAKHLAMKMGKEMVEINLAAVSETLLETRMRGSTKGAFTDAVDKKGFFEEAHNGVLFLDELQSASMASQTQLLDLLSAISNDVWISKVGDDAEKKKYDVKVVLAVNEPVSRLLAEGRLRRDLFHRIRDVVKFKSLNDLFVQDNAPAFLTHIFMLYRWKSFKSAIADDGKVKQVLPQLFTVYEEGVIEKILRAPWPGNFRQLERFASDIFFVLGESTIVTNDLIDRLLKEEANRIPASFIETEPTHNEQNAPTIFSEVETIIKKHNFNLKASLPELGIYRLRTYNALKGFIRENKAQFSKSFLVDSKITKIITSATLGQKMPEK